MKKKKSKLTKYVMFSISMVILLTIVVVILTATTGQNYDTIYSVFCGVFGGEILCSCLIKLFNIKGEQT